MTRLTRRRVLTLSAGAAAAVAAPWPARATSLADLERRHALTVFGEPKHPANFAHFDYVNPDAPRGGALRLVPSSFAFNQNPTTFNTFNMFILRGDSPPLMQLCHTSLMVRGLDEPDAVYGHAAQGVAVDGLRYAFTLRDGITFSDGSPITAEDVVWSLETIARAGHPVLAQSLSDVAAVDAVDGRTVAITFAEGTSNRLPPLVATYPILSRAYYEANDFTAAKLDVPVTSGPYTVGAFDPGRYVAFARRADYWGDAIATGRGHNNFETVRVEFHRERTLAFEAFKTGQLNFREEFTSKTWAIEYDFPALRRGEVVRTTFPDERPAGAQGFFINTRREKFADPRTRLALTLAFDFEWTNANLFYGAYRRTVSFFINSDMMATGEPSAAEVALLEPFRAELDPAVFGPAWTPPTSDATGRDRALLRRASELLAAAGWERRGGRLVNGAGEPLTVEYLYPSEPTSERIFLPYANTLSALGIDARLKPVDPTQYQARMASFDFDLVTRRYAFSPTPDETIRSYFTSEAAAQEGSRNMSGIADPVVDALVEAMLAASTREEMLTAARALDRVLRLGHYWVPQWYKGEHTVAYWDTFGIPDEKPRYDLPVETTWWAKDA
ncbi:extracellular solute-binding protein [Acuticoccus sp.]|uniref:extracellular solute-binding protein n=1 Tax=Acuticoccus sp. TaxID=1904378 RepID=UPI003B518AF8